MVFVTELGAPPADDRAYAAKGFLYLQDMALAKTPLDLAPLRIVGFPVGFGQLRGETHSHLMLLPIVDAPAVARVTPSIDVHVCAPAKELEAMVRSDMVLTVYGCFTPDLNWKEKADRAQQKLTDAYTRGLIDEASSFTRYVPIGSFVANRIAPIRQEKSGLLIAASPYKQ